MTKLFFKLRMTLMCLLLASMCLSCSRAQEVVDTLRPMWRTDLPPLVPPDRYSTRVFRYVMDGRMYHMPENYKFFDFWGRDNTKVYYPSHLQFNLTYPNFEGTTYEVAEVLRHSSNYGRYPSVEIGRKYAVNQIVVYEARPMTKKELETTKTYKESAAYKTVQAEAFSSRRINWKEVDEFNQFELSCISPKSNPGSIYCKGVTLRGESLQFGCQDGLWVAVEMGRCRVERYSVEEGYFAYYEYAKDLLPHWKKIDSGVFATLNLWERK